MQGELFKYRWNPNLESHERYIVMTPSKHLWDFRALYKIYFEKDDSHNLIVVLDRRLGFNLNNLNSANGKKVGNAILKTNDSLMEDTSFLMVRYSQPSRQSRITLA